ncbi:hypothetical protein NL676_007949 [Syzygium grande]|nr:hypothetical protein NL676_007949 [Syzygium grande]
MFPPHTMLPASKFGAGQPHPSFPKSAPSTKTSDRLPNFSFDGFEIVSATTAIVFFNSRSPGRKDSR